MAGTGRDRRHRLDGRGPHRGPAAARASRSSGVVGLVARSGPGPRPPAPAATASTTASRRCWPSRRWTSSTSPAPTTSTPSRPGPPCAAGKHVVCEKPLGVSPPRRPSCWPLADAGGLVNAVCFNLRYYPHNHNAAGLVAGRRAGRAPLRHRQLPPGLAAARHRLELAAGRRAPGQPPGRGRHRLPLARPGQLRQRAPGHRGRCADLHTFVPERNHPARRGRDLRRRRRGRRRRAGPRADGERRRRRASCCASRTACAGLCSVSQVSAGRKNRLGWELDGSDGRAGLGVGGPGVPVDRAPGPAQRGRQQGRRR